MEIQKHGTNTRRKSHHQQTRIIFQFKSQIDSSEFYGNNLDALWEV
jgi:RNAse (barnase) inhibitor barstar